MVQPTQDPAEQTLPVEQSVALQHEPARHPPPQHLLPVPHWPSVVQGRHWNPRQEMPAHSATVQHSPGWQELAQHTSPTSHWLWTRHCLQV